jgi:hypothetical protein
MTARVGLSLEETPSTTDAEHMDFLRRRMPTDGGRTAREHHRVLLSRWRATLRWPFLLAVLFAVGIAIPAGVYFPHGQFFAGMMIGGAWGMIVWVRDDPPDYIARWKRGADGEQQTAEALVGLERDGWRAFHDRAGGRGNLDHIVIGPPGVFLLETKTLSGTITLERAGLTASYGDGARNDFAFLHLERTMRGAAAGLKERIEETTQLRPWVQAVVVIWGDFPEGIAEGDRVVYIAGHRLNEWLRSHATKLNPRNERLIELALDAELVAPPAPAIA